VSNGRSFRRRLVDLLGPLDGLNLPGGCPDCTATQTVRAIRAVLWQIEILHEPTCPTLAARRRKR